jgi:uncharacterized protein (TIGR03435 family)
VTVLLRNLAVVALVVFPLRALAGAWGQGVERPSFEVASIRPTNASPDVFALPDAVRLVGDRLLATKISAVGLIRAAYGAQYASRDQIIAADGWAASERFDVEARASSVLAETPTSTPLPPRAALMLQQLLQDRFRLRLRPDTRRLSRYALTYARADRSLKPGIRISDRDCTSKSFRDVGCEYLPNPGKYTMRGRPIHDFVEFLSRPAYTARPVFDDTGITRNVDIDFQWTMNFTDIMSSNASLLAAIQDQLGLKLEPRDVPLPVLIVEAIQRPSAN